MSKAIKTKVKVMGRGLEARLVSYLPLNEIDRLIFILGCGRSGTSVLGKSLSNHRAITYLNEPRELWFAAYPVADIWTRWATFRNGKLVLDERDVKERQSKRLKKIFAYQTRKTGRPLLVEKLPINNFRLKFINKIFPDARFIHIYRNGMEVAKSIEKEAQIKKWFGKNDYKWRKLAELAKESESTANLPDLCENDIDRGLLEWRFSTESSAAFLSALPRDRYLEFSYANFVMEPESTINNVLEFIGVGSDTKVTSFVCSQVKRRSPAMDRYDLSKKDKLLGGHLLPMSMKTDVTNISVRT